MQKGEENSPPRGRPQAPPKEVVAQDTLSKLDPTALQPEEEEFQGPPGLGVDTQIHPMTCQTLCEPPSLISGAQSHSLITHREALAQLRMKDSSVSQPHARCPPGMAGVLQGSGTLK